MTRRQRRTFCVEKGRQAIVPGSGPPAIAGKKIRNNERGRRTVSARALCIGLLFSTGYATENGP